MVKTRTRDIGIRTRDSKLTGKSETVSGTSSAASEFVDDKVVVKTGGSQWRTYFDYEYAQAAI